MPVAAQRIKDIDVKYDRVHDIVFVHFPPYVLSWDEEDFPGIVVLRSMSDERITGVRIMSYSRQPLALLRVALPFLDVESVLPSTD